MRSSGGQDQIKEARNKKTNNKLTNVRKSLRQDASESSHKKNSSSNNGAQGESSTSRASNGNNTGAEASYCPKLSNLNASQEIKLRQVHHQQHQLKVLPAGGNETHYAH